MKLKIMKRIKYLKIMKKIKDLKIMAMKITVTSLTAS